MNHFDPDAFMGAYLGVGAYNFDATEILADLDISLYADAKDGSEELHVFHSILLARLQANYFRGFDTSMALDFISKNCYGNVEKWHSDAEYVLPGQNATINCFFDDTGPEIGGRFDICQYREGIIGTNQDVPDMCSIYPKKHSIIVFNQNRNWLHKAVGSKNERRMASVACVFREFNAVHPNFVQC